MSNYLICTRKTIKKTMKEQENYKKKKRQK